jgi:hypothetical protein
MTKHSKHKPTSAFKMRQSATVSPQSLLQDARTFPIIECWISADWQNGSGLVQILLVRQQPNERICLGSYLVDKFCLGLKDTFAKPNLTVDRYKEHYDKMSRNQSFTHCPVELAHQMVYEGIDYAAQFGFQPQSDWAQSQYVLEPRGELEESYKLTFGKNGKPFFISGPYDDVKKIIKQLEKTAGPGNFEVLILQG